jgi:hypothetical protein
MNLNPIMSTEIDDEKVEEMKANGTWEGFQGLTKEEYISYTPHQRVMISSGNHQSLEEMDEWAGVKTDIGETEEEQEEFYKGYWANQKKTSDLVLKMMKSEGFFQYKKKE